MIGTFWCNFIASRFQYFFVIPPKKKSISPNENVDSHQPIIFRHFAQIVSPRRDTPKKWPVTALILQWTCLTWDGFPTSRCSTYAIVRWWVKAMVRRRHASSEKTTRPWGTALFVGRCVHHFSRSQTPILHSGALWRMVFSSNAATFRSSNFHWLTKHGHEK